MQDRAWRRHPDQQIQLVLQKSSRERFWTGFEANLYDTSSGIDEKLFTTNSVCMHVGAPALVISRCDGATVRRFQVPGDIKMVPAGLSRVWQTDGPTSKLVVNLSPSFVRSTADEMGANPDRAAIDPRLHLRDAQLEHILWALKAELETVEPVGRLYADSLGVALVAHLLRRYAPVGPRHTISGLPKHRLQSVTDYIHENLTFDLTLAELARVASASPSHFKVLFKQSVGMPVHQYVIRCRVDRATHLLLHGALPLSDVALEAGFANQSHMARCVRRVTGMAPRELRCRA